MIAARPSEAGDTPRTARCCTRGHSPARWVPSLRTLVSLLAAGVALAAALGTSGGDASAGAASGTAITVGSAAGCPQQRLSSRYVRRVSRALQARRDTWGERLLAAPDGPTYERASRYLTPLFFARKRNGRPLTDSGVHYTHFSQPPGARGATSFGLHVADGSQIISRRAHGRHVTVAVGVRGGERYGSCLRRLRGPVLADGYLPILQTEYVDRHGVRYRQESFAARVEETKSLVSFVRLTADASGSRVPLVRLRFTPSSPGLARQGQRLLRDGRTHLFFSPDGAWGAPSVKYGVARGETRTVYLAWLHTPRSSEEIVLDEERYQLARESLRKFWERRLDQGGLIVVPEKRVVDAERNLLIQNMGLTWRYSVGNRYEQLSMPEGVDVARVLAGYGHLGVSRAILRTALRKKPSLPKARTIRRSTNWRMGARLVGFADLHEPGRRECRARRRHARPAWLREATRAPDPVQPPRSPRARALLVGRRSEGVRAALPGGRVARVARARPCVAGSRLPGSGNRVPQARSSARSRVAPGGEGVPATAAGRGAVRAGDAARRRAPVRLADRNSPRELLEPGRAVRARVGLLPAGGPTGRRRAQVRCAGTARACSVAYAPGRSPSTGRKRIRSPGRARSTG